MVKPLHIKQIVTPFRIKTLIITLTLFFLVWNGEIAFRADLSNVTGPQNMTTPVCQVIYDYGLPPKIFVIKPVITTLFLRTLLPVAIILPSNIGIIVKLWKQKEARSAMVNTSTQNVGRGQCQGQGQASKTTWMIVSASLAFILMSTPLSVYLMIRYSNRDKFKGTDTVLEILGLIYRLSPAVNFYCYFLSGGLFKQEVKKWLTEFKIVKNCRNL